jgi:hypothetical protein
MSCIYCIVIKFEKILFIFYTCYKNNKIYASHFLHSQIILKNMPYIFYLLEKMYNFELYIL